MNEYFFPLSEAYQLVHNLEKLKADFRRVGEEQRGLPESWMLKFQTALGGGLHSYLAEHVGDLSHRASILDYSGQPAGYEYVNEKVNRCLKYLTQAYGFEKERLENLQANTNMTYLEQNPKISKQYERLRKAIKTKDKLGEEAWRAAIDIRNKFWNDLKDNPAVIQLREKIDAECRRIGKCYASAHRVEVNPLTTLQQLGRLAAIGVGEYNFDSTIYCLRKIQIRIADATKEGTLDELWFDGYKG